MTSSLTARLLSTSARLTSYKDLLASKPLGVVTKNDRTIAVDIATETQSWKRPEFIPVEKVKAGYLGHVVENFDTFKPETTAVVVR